MFTLDTIKVVIPAMSAFLIGIALTPLITHYLYKYRVWKKTVHKTALDGTVAQEFGKLRTDVETKTPRMGGIVIWSSVLITTLLFWILPQMFPDIFTIKFSFLSRSQTWIPFVTLMAGALVGFINDVLDVTSLTGERGIRIKYRLLVIAALATFIGWWFYAKLGVTGISIPFNGELFLGWLIIPFFVLVTLALYASGVIDGIDGLSGGVFASIFAAYGIIAYSQSQIDLAAFCAAVVGGILAFLWFNIPPARFWMTETGSMGLTITIAAIAFLTDSLGEGEGVLVLPVVAFLLVVTVASNVLQVLWKKAFGRKLFRIAPLHHHFEALGWPGYKVTMRYWVLSVFFAIMGVIFALVS